MREVLVSHQWAHYNQHLARHNLVMFCCTGPAPCFVMGHAQLLGKTVGSARGIKGCIRSKIPLFCAQGAMGRYLVARFTIQKEKFPVDPFDPAWQTLKLWPSSTNPHKTMSYTNHLTRTRALFILLCIAAYKATHCPRIFAARLADEFGLDEKVISSRDNSLLLSYDGVAHGVT